MNPIIRIYVLYGVCTGATAAFLIPNMILLGGSQADIAQMRLFATLAGLLLSVPTGWLADRLGHKAITIGGFVLLVAAFAAPAASTTLQALIITGTLVAAADATVLGAVQLWTRDLDPKIAKLDTVEKLKIFDQRQRYGMIAGAVGIPLVLTLVKPNSAALGWIIVLVAALVLIGTAYATGSNVRARSKESFGERLQERYNLTAILAYAKRSGGLVLLAAIALFVVGFAEEISTNIYWPRMARVVDLSVPIYKGLTMASTSIARVLGMSIFFALAKSRNKANSPFLPGLAVVASSVFFLAFAFADGTISAFILWSLRVVTVVLYFPTYQALVLRHAPESFKATWFSAAGMIMALGAIVANSLLSAINPSFESVSFVVLGALATALGGAIWFLVAWADQRLGMQSRALSVGPS